jgi:hypothetical protein
VAQRCEARRFFDDHYVVIDEMDFDIVFTWWWGLRVLENSYDFTFSQPATFVQAKITVDLHPARLNKSFDFAPRLFR